MLFIVVFLMGIGWIFFRKNQILSRKCGSIIILNGPSAAGKTSLQKKFQKMMMPNLWIKLGIDTLFDAPMPDIDLENMAEWQKENPIRWVTNTSDDAGNQVITLLTGDQGDRVAYGMNSAIAEYAKSGCNVIMDYIPYKKEWTSDLQQELAGLSVYWVKVSAPIETLEAREIARGTSPKGHARSHYLNVENDGISYQLEIDTSQTPVNEGAEKLKNLVLGLG